MFVIHSGRVTGKTTRLVKAFLDDPEGVLVVRNCVVAQQILREFDVPGKKYGRITTYRMFPEALRGLERPWNIYVDDIEWFAREHFEQWGTLKGVTLSFPLYGGDGKFEV